MHTDQHNSVNYLQLLSIKKVELKEYSHNEYSYNWIIQEH